MNNSNVRIFCVSTLFLVISVSLGIIYLNQSVEAQNTTDSTNINSSSSNATNAIDTFRAQGQISSLSSDTVAGRTDNSTENVIWVLGGDWEFNVADGNLTNFVVDIIMTKVDGTAAHQHTIEK